MDGWMDWWMVGRNVTFSWKTASCLIAQKFPNIVWNTKVHCRVHLSFTLVSLSLSLGLHQSDPHYPILYMQDPFLILPSRIHLGLFSGIISSIFHTKILCVLLCPAMRATCPVHLSLFLITFVEDANCEAYICYIVIFLLRKKTCRAYKQESWSQDEVRQRCKQTLFNLYSL
jgi:hypothetical protein